MLRYAGESDVRALDAQKVAQLRALSRLPARQQPPWQDHPELPAVRTDLAELPGLIDQRQVRALRQLLSRAQAGAALLLHVGECAETFAMAHQRHVDNRMALYERLADRLAERTGREVILLTRMAGQHAKPRSEAVEVQPDGIELPVYRGDAVNGMEPGQGTRRPHPGRLLASYRHSRDTLELLRGRLRLGHPVFVSHEALIRDYEEALTRLDEDAPRHGTAAGAHYRWAQLYALSGHFLWIGERTRQPADWHVQWAASIANPVGVKVGPAATGADLAALVRTLNPRREHGRLTLIPRLGAHDAARRLHALAKAAGDAGAPVLWQCDPMHGNTLKIGRTKLRLLPQIRGEITAFVRTLRRLRCQPAGLHLEVTPEPVRECHEDLSDAIGQESNAPCDPRLSPEQAMEIVDHFAHEIGGYK